MYRVMFFFQNQDMYKKCHLYTKWKTVNCLCSSGTQNNLLLFVLVYRVCKRITCSYLFHNRLLKFSSIEFNAIFLIISIHHELCLRHSKYSIFNISISIFFFSTRLYSTFSKYLHFSNVI